MTEWCWAQRVLLKGGEMLLGKVYAECVGETAMFVLNESFARQRVLLIEQVLISFLAQSVLFRIVVLVL